MLCTLRSKAWPVRGDQLGNITHKMTWHPSLVNLQEAHTYMKDAALTEACSKHAKSSKMHGRSSLKKQQEPLKSWRWCNRGLAPCDSDTDLFEEVHEARAEAPGFVAVTLQGADGHLSGPLGRDGHHEHRVVHQGHVCLWRSQREEDVDQDLTPHSKNPRQAHNYTTQQDTQTKRQWNKTAAVIQGRLCHSKGKQDVV